MVRMELVRNYITISKIFIESAIFVIWGLRQDVILQALKNTNQKKNEIKFLYFKYRRIKNDIYYLTHFLNCLKRPNKRTFTRNLVVKT